MPKLRIILPAALALALSAPVPAQLTPLQDPANLAGERVSPQDPADTLPLNHGAPALQQLLAKLRTRASLMLIVAHPDDEDGGLLTYESRGQGARVAMLTLTRGEGGQNLMSADFDDALGLIRTQELLAADRYFGVDQFFGTEVDFGFSKTKEESFAKWTHERVLYDAVRAVRLYRPLVIASVFVGGPTDGHGQHQVAGEIAQEVFLAAADPNVFPEMIAEGLLPWAPLKVYARVPFSRVTPEGMYDYATGKTIPTRFHNYVTGEDSTAVPTATVLIHEGDKPSDPTLAAAMGGDTFVQFARRGLALQKTQIGPNVRLAPPGAFDAPYTLMATRLGCISTKAGCPIFATVSPSLRWVSTKPTPEQSLFDGIDTSLPGIATLALTSPIDLRTALTSIDKDIAEAQRLFDPAKPKVTASYLKSALHRIDDLLSIMDESQFGQRFAKANIMHELRLKRVQLNNALVFAYGMTLQPQIGVASTELVANQSLRVDSHFFGDQDPAVSFTQVKLEVAPTLLKPGLLGQINLSLTATISSAPPPTRPYFFRHNSAQPFYDLNAVSLRNAPATPPPLVEALSFSLDGTLLEMRGVVCALQTAQPSPAMVVPPLSVHLTPATGIVSIADANDTRLHVKSIVGTTAMENNGQVRLNIPVSWKVEPDSSPLALSSSHKEEQTSFILIPPHKLIPSKAYSINAVATLDGHDYTESFRPVGYPGIPYTNFYTPATYRVTAVDLNTAPNLQIAYLPGTGDTVPDFLPNLGITPTLLTLKDLTPATLNKYDAILLGVRAYAAHPELSGPGSQPLLDYAKAGGVVIVQYNTARYGDPEAPFPITVPGDSAHNVVEEAQPVTLLQPGAPLLTWPNKITPADFDHWVAERGHGFAATWSPSYTPLLETHDAGQDPQQGGLLLARTGKGAYIYCALALYRQLPEGVPGAYRLLANLLSYAKNPHFAQ